MAFGPNPPRIQAHICVSGGDAALGFYELAFGARCTFKAMASDNIRILHANLELFGGEVMLHDEFPELGGDVLAPTTRGGASVTIHVNLPRPSDVDAVISRAHGSGASIVLPAADMDWGARYGRVRDPFGHIWAFNAPLQG